MRILAAAFVCALLVACSTSDGEQLPTTAPMTPVGLTTTSTAASTTTTSTLPPVTIVIRESIGVSE